MSSSPLSVPASGVVSSCRQPELPSLQRAMSSSTAPASGPAPSSLSCFRTARSLVRRRADHPAAPVPRASRPRGPLMSRSDKGRVERSSAGRAAAAGSRRDRERVKGARSARCPRTSMRGSFLQGGRSACPRAGGRRGSLSSPPPYVSARPLFFLHSPFSHPLVLHSESSFSPSPPSATARQRSRARARSSRGRAVDIPTSAAPSTAPQRPPILVD